MRFSGVQTDFPILAAAVFMLVIGGCTPQDAVRCQPVRGQVLFDGQALAEAVVVFHSKAETKTTLPKSLAYTDAQGRFELTTLKSNDGAPVGDYAITVELNEPRQVGEELVRDGRNLLPERYGHPDSSGFSYRVVEGGNDVPPLRITSNSR